MSSPTFPTTPEEIAAAEAAVVKPKLTPVRKGDFEVWPNNVKTVEEQAYEQTEKDRQDALKAANGDGGKARAEALKGARVRIPVGKTSLFGRVEDVFLIKQAWSLLVTFEDGRQSMCLPSDVRLVDPLPASEGVAHEPADITPLVERAALMYDDMTALIQEVDAALTLDSYLSGVAVSFRHALMLFQDAVQGLSLLNDAQANTDTAQAASGARSGAASDAAA